MAASTFTEHYELGVYQGHDYVSFLGTYNDAMRKIDNGMFQNQQNGNATASDLDTVKGQMQTVQANITAVNQQLEGYNIPGMKTEIAANKTEISEIDVRVESIENELQSADLSDIGTQLTTLKNINKNNENYNTDMVGTKISFSPNVNPTLILQNIVNNNGHIQGFVFCNFAAVAFSSIQITIQGSSVIAFKMGTCTIPDGVYGIGSFDRSVTSGESIYIGPIYVANNNVYLLGYRSDVTNFTISRFSLHFF